MTTRSPFLLLALSLVLSACSSGGDGGDGSCAPDTTYAPAIDPANFSSTVDNPLFPLVAGTKLTYQSSSEYIEVTVTDQTIQLMGVTAVAVHDEGWDGPGGNVIEDTLDYYAQASDGAVWYFGEDTTEYANGESSTEGSWKAGVDGAQPGVLIPATPTAGDKYRQEYKACSAEDYGEVLALDQSADVQAGSYTGCLKTRDTTPLEPNANEEKYYCPGVGLALTVDVTNGGDREELISVEAP